MCGVERGHYDGGQHAPIQPQASHAFAPEARLPLRRARPGTRTIGQPTGSAHQPGIPVAAPRASEPRAPASEQTFTAHAQADDLAARELSAPPRRPSRCTQTRFLRNWLGRTKMSPRPTVTRSALKRHRLQCQICRRADCAEIEQEYLDWTSPRQIAAAFKLGSYRALYRHIHALGLFEARTVRMRLSLDRIAERVSEIPPAPTVVLGAIRLALQVDEKRAEAEAKAAAAIAPPRNRDLQVALDGFPRTNAATPNPPAPVPEVHAEEAQKVTPCKNDPAETKPDIAADARPPVTPCRAVSQPLARPLFARLPRRKARLARTTILASHDAMS